MEPKNDIIVALEFGTSSIRGVAGCKKADGNLQILGIEYEDTQESILKGVIYNIDKTTQAIKSIIGRLSEQLGAQIYQAYVGISGQSLHTEANTVKRNLATTVKITPELVDNLKDNNRLTSYPDAEILEVIAQEYIVGKGPTLTPLGVMSDHIEAHFLNIVARTTLRENIEKCMRAADVAIVGEPVIAPLALADALLTGNEKRSGCALVDFGAGTTTVQIYKDNILRHLVVLPLGGNSITGDIMSEYLMESEDAERLKRKHGQAYVATPTEKPKQLAYGDGRAVDENELQDTIGARQEEIIENVKHQLKDYGKILLSGIVCTGGASKMQDMVIAIQHFIQSERSVKNAKSLLTTVDVAPGVNNPVNKNFDGAIAILMQGRVACTRDMGQEDAAPELPAAGQDTDPTPADIPSTEQAQPSAAETEENSPAEPKIPKTPWYKRLGKALKDMMEEDTDV